MKKEFLEIVDENDIVIGRELRNLIHERGLLHRETHVWFVTPKGEIVFQHRSKNKDTYPDVLDATVGGHVEPGMTYEDTAIKEVKEETGIKIKKEDLHLIRKTRTCSKDVSTGKINNTHKVQFAYVYRGKISELKVEEGESAGFESWPIDKILNLSSEDQKKFVPNISTPRTFELFREIQKLVGR